MSVKGFATLNKLLGKKKDKSQPKLTTNKIMNSSQLQQDNCIAQLPVATSTTPFEQTFRITVLLPRDQLYVTRLGAKVKLEKLLDLVCENKLLDCELYEFRHPIDTSQVFNLESTIGAVGLTELRLCNKSETYDNFNADEIIKMRHQTVERDSLSSSEFSAKKSHNTLKTASPYSSTNSLNSMDSTGMNTNYRAPIKIPLQTNGKQQPPIPPARKKRKAPLPPIPAKIYENISVTENNNNNVDGEEKFNGFKKPINKQNFYMSTPNISNGIGIQAREFNHSNLSINGNDTSAINGRRNSENRSKLRPLSIQYDNNSSVLENQPRMSNRSNGSSEGSKDHDKIDSPIYAEVAPRKKSAPLPPPRTLTRPVASPRKISTLQLNEVNGSTVAENYTSITQLNSPNNLEYPMNVTTPPSQFKDAPIPDVLRAAETKISSSNHLNASSPTSTLNINGVMDSESSTDEVVSPLTNGSTEMSIESDIPKSPVSDEVENISTRTSISIHDAEIIPDEPKNYEHSIPTDSNPVTETINVNTAYLNPRPSSPEPIVIPAPENFADITLKGELQIKQELKQNEPEILNTTIQEEQKPENKSVVCNEQLIQCNTNTKIFKNESEDHSIIVSKKRNEEDLPTVVSNGSELTTKTCYENIEGNLKEKLKEKNTETSSSINKSDEEAICDFSIRKSDEIYLNTNSKDFISSNLNQDLKTVSEIDTDNKPLQQSNRNSNLKNFKISTYRPLSVAVKTFSEQSDLKPASNSEEDKVYVKKLNMITLQKDPMKRRSNITRSDSFHSTRHINDYNDNQLRSRSSSVYSLLASQNAPFQELVKMNGKSSSQLSISESPSLQSLIVMKSILSSRQNSISNQDELPMKENGTKPEKNNSFAYNNGTVSENKIITTNGSPICSENSTEQDEPTKKWKYQGPPSINLSTWSERPKVQPVAIKNEGDYIIGGGQGPLNISTSIIKKDYRKSMPSALFALQEMNNSDNKFSSIQYGRVNGNPVPSFINKTNNANIFRSYNTNKEQLKIPATNSIQKDTNNVESKELWKIDATKSLDRSKLRAKPNRHSYYEGLDNRLNKKADEQTIPAFAQITLRKTGLKEKIVAANSAQNGTNDLKLSGNNAGFKVKSNENNKLEIKVKADNPQNSSSFQCNGKKVVQPPPPPPPIIRSVVTKQNSASLAIDPRDQLLSAIRNFNRDSLKQS